ncbi:MAG: hypothetical protein Q9192_009100, partial [Flavoplaca navasiana]
TVSLFYVGRNNNTLSCLNWEPDGDLSQCKLNLEQSLLAADSRQISAIWLPINDTSRCVLLIYPDPSQKLIISRLSSDQDYNTNRSNSIIDETAKFNSALNNFIQIVEPGSPDAYLAKTCTAVSYRDADDFRESFYLNCFVNKHNGEAPSEMDGHDSETPTQESSVVEFTFDVDISNGNITIDN